MCAEILIQRSEPVKIAIDDWSLSEVEAEASTGDDWLTVMSAAGALDEMR
jgi:hypothetical protein